MCLIYDVWRPVSEAQDKGPKIGTEDDDNPVDDDEAAEEAKEEEPEPDEDVDFFIDCNKNIQTQVLHILQSLHLAYNICSSSKTRRGRPR